uniref:Uncharacterized protein n=1 Tax=Periophthalmus magnuspinnatus TaxID=409849 RepID=A0A3B3ZYN5_9GOBI
PCFKLTGWAVIFVVGIGFFSLCFLMTSLGGQFSAKRLGDSPFTIRTEGNNTRYVCLQRTRRCCCANTITPYNLIRVTVSLHAHRNKSERQNL